MRAREETPPRAAIVMFVQIDANDVSIVRASATEDLPDSAGRFDSWSRGEGGRDALVLAFADDAGVLRESTEVAAEIVTFLDRPDPRRVGGLSGGMLRPAVDRRLIHVAVPPGATYLLFYKRAAVRTDERGEGGSGRSIPLALFSLVEVGDRRAPSALNDLADFASPVPPARRFPWEVVPFNPPPIGPQPPPAGTSPVDRGPGPGNYIQSFETLKPCEVTPASRGFNIVITGDGFADMEMVMFDARVKELIARLLKMPPFDDPVVQARLAVHVVRAVSRHSGVDNCPYPDVRKDTYFDVEGNWGGVGYAGYPGTWSEGAIYDAGALFALPSRIALYVVLVNTALYGGKGHKGTSIAYASIESDDETLANLVAHESAHAFAGLVDEYMGWKPVLKHDPYPNLATLEDIKLDRVPWKHLAKPYELKSNGRFRAYHWVGKPFDMCTGEPILESGLQDMLGLFWGCCYVDPGPPPSESDSRPDPRGANYFRPMARCKMRRLAWPFCRACEEHIKAVILGQVRDPGTMSSRDRGGQEVTGAVARRRAGRPARRPARRPATTATSSAAGRRRVGVRDS